jgi:hypothetical protein
VKNDPENCEPSIQDLVGTWRFAVDDEIQDAGLLHFSDTGLVFMCGFSTKRNFRINRLWRQYYSEEAPGVLRLRTKPGHPGLTRTFKFEDGNLILPEITKVFVCSRVAHEQVPQWFQEKLVESLAHPD